jgi:hypothetical protein
MEDGINQKFCSAAFSLYIPSIRNFSKEKQKEAGGAHIC